MPNVIYLGDNTANTAPIQTPETVPTVISDPRQVKLADISKNDPAMPIGYALFDDGIYFAAADEFSPHVHVCSPLRVDTIFSNGEGKGWGKVISVKNVDGVWQDVHVMSADLSGSSAGVLRRLIDHGLQLAPNKKAKALLQTFLNQSKPAARMITVSKFGWVDKAHTTFALPDRPIGTMAIVPMFTATGIAESLACKGSVEDWKRAIGMSCCDNPMMILAVSLAFSGPLLSILGADGGGLHFRGCSASGKTTLLGLAASVWGRPRLVTQWRATGNGLEGIASSLNDMLLPLDEIAAVSANELGGTIYMLANGTGKTRRTEATESWRLAVISSGEISVKEKLKEANKTQMTGHEVRLIDIEADGRTFGVFDELHGVINGSVFADDLKSAAEKFHGVAGRAFVEFMILNC